MDGRTASRASLGPFALLVALSIAVPLGVLAYVLVPPASEIRLDDRVQHFAITTNVSLIAASVAVAVMRAALDARHWPSVLVALGFLSLAGIFAVHGLATPGVLLRGDVVEISAGSVVALSAQLSLAVPAWLFALRYTPLIGRLRRSTAVTPRRALAAVATAIVLYAYAGLTQPARVADLIEALTGYGVSAAYGGYNGSALQGSIGFVLFAAAVTIALLVFAAVRQTRDFARSRHPSHGAIAIAYLLLAEAQVAMAIGPAFSLAFWEYHGMMATAVVLALGALFVELDRRRGLERFLPPTVVDRVVTGDALSLEGQRRTATILFTDLRGSTTLAERLSPEAAVATVNTYLRAMARTVIDEGGILDKFTGDGLMAIFGAMSSPALGAAAAARAASRIRHDLGILNVERTERGEPTAGYGIGISTGDVVLGAVGLPERSDYTAMGDTVNTAARMESLTKELEVDIVLTESTAAHLRGSFDLRPLGSATVKGKSAPIAVYTLR